MLSYRDTLKLAQIYVSQIGYSRFPVTMPVPSIIEGRQVDLFASINNGVLQTRINPIKEINTVFSVDVETGRVHQLDRGIVYTLIKRVNGKSRGTAKSTDIDFYAYDRIADDVRIICSKPSKSYNDFKLLCEFATILFDDKSCAISGYYEKVLGTYLTSEIKILARHFLPNQVL